MKESKSRTEQFMYTTQVAANQPSSRMLFDHDMKAMLKVVDSAV